MKMTATRKTKLLVSWCNQHKDICDSANTKWRVEFSNHYANFTLELTLHHHSDDVVISNVFVKSSTTKHKALENMLESLNACFVDVPNSFEEMAILGVVGA